MAVDKPKVNLTFAQLEAEAAAPEPYVFVLPNSKRITFPDIFDMEAEEADDFLEQFKDAKNDFGILEKWLPKADFEEYRKAKLKLRMHGLLVQKVMAYYENTFGSPEKGNASGN